MGCLIVHLIPVFYNLAIMHWWLDIYAKFHCTAVNAVVHHYVEHFVTVKAEHDPWIFYGTFLMLGVQCSMTFENSMSAWLKEVRILECEISWSLWPVPRLPFHAIKSFARYCRDHALLVCCHSFRTSEHCAGGFTLSLRTSTHATDCALAVQVLACWVPAGAPCFVALWPFWIADRHAVEYFEKNTDRCCKSVQDLKLF